MWSMYEGMPERDKISGCKKFTSAYFIISVRFLREFFP